MASTHQHGSAFLKPDGKPHLLIVEARFYDDLADALLEGAKAALAEAGATYDVVTEPWRFRPSSLSPSTAPRRAVRTMLASLRWAR